MRALPAAVQRLALVAIRRGCQVRRKGSQRRCHHRICSSTAASSAVNVQLARL
jgi:hypothetical protein